MGMGNSLCLLSGDSSDTVMLSLIRVTEPFVLIGVAIPNMDGGTSLSACGARTLWEKEGSFSAELCLLEASRHPIVPLPPNAASSGVTEQVCLEASGGINIILLYPLSGEYH